MATKKYISLSSLTKFFDNLKNLFATKTEVDTKSDKTHTHTIADIANLQSALDSKSNSSHGTHVTYSTTSPVMDGIASAGSANTVARSDHKHPTDTSRASQTSLDSHTSNTTSHITSTERTNWNEAYAHSKTAHAPSDAESNQNAFSNVKIGDVTIAADIKTDTLTLVAGNNITLTPDATNDKITISAKDTTYSLSSFGITSTASELNKLDGVTASTTELNYVDGVTSNIQTQLDNKASKSHNHTVSNITDLKATATELNYMDGVTSSVQTQIDSLASIVDDEKAKRISLTGQCQTTSYRTSVIALCKAPTNSSCGNANNSYSSGQLTFARSNGLYAPVIAIVSMSSSHGATNRVRVRHLCSSGFSIFKPCTFTYNGITYGGLEVKTSDAEAHNVTFVGETTFDIFALDIYDSNQKVVLNEEVYNSISYDNPVVESGWKDANNSVITSATIGSQSVASATKDGGGNVITSTYEKKTDATNKLSEAKTYADNVANKVKNDLLNGAGSAYDTLKELGDLITVNKDAIDVLEDVAAGKANASHSHAISDITNLQTTLDSKQTNVTGGASTITSSNLTTNRALISNGSGKVAVSAVTSTELGYLDGASSNIQTQLDGKAASGHTHSYAGSSSVGGAATSANKLNTNAGSATQPVYFENGIPVKTTYTLGKSVPSDAKFTDTTYSVATTSANGLMSSTDKKEIDSISGSYSLGSFASKTVADLQTALDTWLNSYVNIANSSAKFQASQDWVTAWNSGNTASTISAGGTWTVTNIAPYSTKAYAQLRIAYYSDEWVVYVHRSSGNWGTAHQVAYKDDLTSKQDIITGGASTITSSNLTANRALISNGSGKVAVSAVTNTELGYLDGVTSNVQTQLDGKSNTSHTHNYAGSSGAGGSANSAVKLQTARSIGLGNDLTGSANFDGSGNVTISAKHYNTSVNSGNKSNYPYHRFAYKGSKASPITGQYNDTDAIFCIRETYNGGGYGVLKVSLRTNSSTSVSQASATWLARYNFSLDDVKIGLYNVAGATYADLYIKVGTYARTTVIQLEGNRAWTLVSSSEVNDTTTTDAKTSTECYVSIETAATTLHGQAYSSIISSVDGGQVNYANSSGSATTASTCTGNSATATKLSSARTISLTGDVAGSTSFDGSGNVSITAAVADDSHNHVISNVDGLQSALDGKSATSHNHDSAYIKKSLQLTADNGAQKLSYYKNDGKNILTEFAALTTGMYTAYSQSGTAGNPKTTEAWRFMIHKTGNTTGWVQGYGSLGSVYTNYQDGDSGWRGWRCIWDNDPNPLWSGAMYMSSSNSTPQTVTPSKKLSECRTGWLLLWSDYDAGDGANDADFATTIIPKNNPSGGTWGGKSFLCDIPRYVGSNAEDVDTERRIIKPIYVHDNRIEGSYQNAYDERNDVVLRAVYEI